MTYSYILCQVWCNSLFDILSIELNSFIEQIQITKEKLNCFVRNHIFNHSSHVKRAHFISLVYAIYAVKFSPFDFAMNPIFAPSFSMQIWSGFECQVVNWWHRWSPLNHLRLQLQDRWGWDSEDFDFVDWNLIIVEIETVLDNYQHNWWG